jgi:hypothetical protein
LGTSTQDVRILWERLLYLLDFEKGGFEKRLNWNRHLEDQNKTREGEPLWR